MAVRLFAAWVVLAFMLLPTLAMGLQEEYLLQSWGMQQDASGRLVFSQPMPRRQQSYQPWQPERITPPLKLPANPANTTGLQPLVVSSRQKERP